MKKATKKILTLALSTLFVGAGLGGAVAAYDSYNATVAFAAIADMTKVDAPIACAMPLEAGKVKNITSWGYYDSNADGVGDVWAFKGDGTASGQPEIRFSTPGTDTTLSSDSRTYKPMKVNKITVEYNITNSGTALAESSTTKYLLQILGATEGTGSPNQYYYHVPEIIDDGEWHTLTIDLNSVFSGGSNENLPMNISSFDDINELVCCWNFKMGKDFNGEVMFRNFQVEEAVSFVDISGEIYNVNQHGNGDWGACGDYKEAGLYRFWLDEDKALNWSDAGVANCLNDAYPNLLNYIKVNGKTIKEWRDLYAAGQTNAITWTGMPANEAPKAMQNNIAEDVNAGRAIYAPIFVSLVNHGGSHGSALDIYIPTSFMPEVNSIEFLKGFEWEYNGQTFGFSKSVTFKKSSSYARAGKSYSGSFANVVETTVTGINGSYGAADQFLTFDLGTSDYGEANTVALSDKTVIWSLNYFDYIEIDGQKLGTVWGTDLLSEQFYGVWGRTGSFGTRWPSLIKNAGTTDSVQQIKILAGCQFPSKDDIYGTVYEVKEDLIFNRQADGSFALYVEEPEVPDVPVEPEEPELTNVDITGINYHGRWGTGDFAGNMAHIRLNIAGDVTWTEANASVNNAHLPASVLENIWVNGKSIAQHNAEYKALIESGAESPITWDSSIAFNGEIAHDVANGNAVYSPIFIKLVNHGAGLAGNTIDMYIPNSYLSAEDIKEVRITKDFSYETETAKFTVSDDVIFKSNSLCVPDKYIGEANVPQLNLTVEETTVEKVMGNITGDSMLSFYLGNNDYPTSGDVAWTGTNDFLKQINYYDYIEFDGVKLGTLWNYSGPGEKFVRVWSRQNAFTTRWPTNLTEGAARENIQKITVLAGAQFPSAENVAGKVYEVKETVTFINMGNGEFVREDYLVNSEDITFTQATDVGEALEMVMFEISYANWNSTRDTYDFNYFGDQFTAMRKKIFINGVSLWDINTTVDDSGYNYATGPWSNGDAVSNGYQIFQNPTLIRGEGNKLMVYVHKDYLNAKGINVLTVTVAKNFTHSETPAYVVGEDVTANVWTRPLTVTFNTNGGSAIDAMTVPYGTPASALATVPAPTKDGYTFTGWTLENGYAIPDGAIVETDIVVVANWTINEYTAKVVRADGSEETVNFTIENRADVLATIALTANTAQYSYAWVEALPEVLALNNDQVFTETKSLNNYTITFNTNGGTEIDAMVVPYGTPASALATIEAPTKEYYTFAGWTFEDGSAIPAGATVTMDLTVVAAWTADEFTAKIVRADGTEEIVTFTIDNRAEVLASIALTESDEYITYYWAEELPEELALNNEQVFTELKETTTFTIELVKSMFDMPEYLTLEYGAPLELEVLSGEHKTFLGWFSISYDEYWNEVYMPAPATVTGDMTLYPIWDVHVYTVALVENGNVVKEVKFGVEYAEGIDSTAEDLAFTLPFIMPADTRYSYEFVDAIPDTFEYKDYELEIKTVVAPQDYSVFKFSMNQVKTGKLVYLDGDISGRYLTTTEDAAKAIDMTAEKTENGYKFYTEIDGEYYYLNIYYNEENKISVNYELEADCAYYVFNYDAECNCWYTDVDGTSYYLGSYNEFNTISASKISYINAGNTGTEQFPLELVQTYGVTIVYDMNNWVVKTMNVIDGTVITLDTPVAEGKEFLCWTDVDGNVLMDTTYTVNGEGFAAFATWNVFTYTFTVNVGEETYTYIFGVEGDWMTGALSIEDMLYELSMLLPVETETTTYKWDVEIGDTLELKDYTITMVEEERIYEVTVITNRFEIPTTVTGKYGETIELTVPTAEGKVFAGWVDLEGNEITEATFGPDMLAIYATWTVTPYTLTIVNGEETTVITFGVMADPANGVEAEAATLAFVLENLLPENTAEFTYAWAEEIPEAFELKDYTFTVVATAVEQPEEPSDEPTEEPKDEPTEEPKDEPTEEPKDEPTEEPEQPAEPSITDQVKDLIPDSIKNAIPGCSGVVGGIAGGAAALGLAVVALLKKKEDNE